MRILFVHNKYRGGKSGEEASIAKWMNLLVQNDHIVEILSEETESFTGISGKVVAAIKSFYSRGFERELKESLVKFKPDLLICQNVFPLISFSFLRIVKRKKIPLLLRAPNYRLFCPIGTFYSEKNGLCERCTSGLMEFNCILGNCRQNRVESFYYAIRNYFNRQIWKPLKSFDGIVVQSEFQKQKFISLGVEPKKLFVIGGYSEFPPLLTAPKGDYISFIGRPTREKGIEVFLRLAKEFPQFNFRVVGNVDSLDIDKAYRTLSNLQFSGFLSGDDLIEAYKMSSVVIVPSVWYEGFPNIIADAMKLGVPVITSKLGAMTSILVHGDTGLLANPNDLYSFKNELDRLLNNENLRNHISKNSKLYAQEHFTSSALYEDLEGVISYLLRDSVS